MRLGPADGPAVAVSLPLFEEANRARAVAVATLRALAGMGIAGALPDLPGQSESPVPTGAMTLADLRAAFAAAVEAIGAGGRPLYVASIRSGALVDGAVAARGRWHLSPQDGPALLRELGRIGPRDLAGGQTLIAGNLIAPRFLDELADAVPPVMPGRVVRLDGDPRPADRHLAGSPPWRRAEPDGDDVLAQMLAADIADWVRRCEGR